MVAELFSVRVNSTRILVQHSGSSSSSSDGSVEHQDTTKAKTDTLSSAYSMIVYIVVTAYIAAVSLMKQSCCTFFPFIRDYSLHM
jgi:hypothetical protein